MATPVGSGPLYEEALKKFEEFKKKNVGSNDPWGRPAGQGGEIAFGIPAQVWNALSNAPKPTPTAPKPTPTVPGAPAIPAPVAGLAAAAPTIPGGAGGGMATPLANPLAGGGGGGGLSGEGATGAQMLNAPNALRQGIGTRIPPVMSMALAGLQRIY